MDNVVAADVAIHTEVLAADVVTLGQAADAEPSETSLQIDPLQAEPKTRAADSGSGTKSWVGLF